MNKQILLLNIDSSLPNIALHKIAMWHEQQGDIITWDMPMMLDQVDKAYASCIFTANKYICNNYKGLRADINIGGTGYDLSVKLPNEIDSLNPKINYGFTTRGCIRKCPFCFVWQSEGYIKVVGDLYTVWDGTSNKITLLDNNILALPEQFEKVCLQAQKERVTIDFNQGLDIRLITAQACQLLFNTKIAEYRFAFDHPSLEPIIREKIILMRKYKPRARLFLYVLVGFNTTFEEDLYRCNIIKELGCRAYVMRHENTPKERRYTLLAEWTNQMWTFIKYDFETFCIEKAKK